VNVDSKKFTLIYFLVVTASPFIYGWITDWLHETHNIEFEQWLKSIFGYAFLILIIHAYMKAWEVWVKPRMMKDQEE